MFTVEIFPILSFCLFSWSFNEIDTEERGMRRIKDPENWFMK